MGVDLSLYPRHNTDMNRHEHNSLRIRIEGRHCVYCGERPNTDEHFPPVSHGLGGYILPACHECNGLAGTLHPTDFKRRAEHVTQRLRKRYAHILPVTLDAILAEDESKWFDMLKMEQVRRRIVRRLEWDAQLYVRSIAERHLAGINQTEWTQPKPKPLDTRNVGRCDHCGEPLLGRPPHVRFCSPFCRASYERGLHRVKRLK
jgi:hypothetical protein